MRHQPNKEKPSAAWPLLPYSHAGLASSAFCVDMWLRVAKPAIILARCCREPVSLSSDHTVPLVQPAACRCLPSTTAPVPPTRCFAARLQHFSTQALGQARSWTADPTPGRDPHSPQYTGIHFDYDRSGAGATGGCRPCGRAAAPGLGAQATRERGCQAGVPEQAGPQAGGQAPLHGHRPVGLAGARHHHCPACAHTAIMHMGLEYTCGSCHHANVNAHLPL